MSSISPIKSYPLTSTTSPLTNVNSVTFVQDSEFGSVASFNGSNYLLIEQSDVPSQVYGQNWSFSFWAKNNNVNSTKEPFSVGVNSTNRRITANIDTNVFLGYSGSNSIGSETAPMNLQSNVWYHYCFVRSGSNFKFYIDGLKVIDDVSSGVSPSSTSFKIGTNHDLNQRWDGYMTDVRIYGVSLSDSEALALSSNPHTSGTVDPNLVTWVINNGSYEVSSKNHLLQIMNSGSLFTNAGSVPTDYMSSSYIQTVDIDLESDSTNIVPISTFTGVYDGQGYSISNWNCTPLSGKGTALFGITVNATIKNLVLDGVWQALGTNDGAFLAAHNTSSQFYNITTDFSPGTEITARINSLGGLFAYTGSCTLQNITLGGTIDRLEGTVFTGGIVGYSGFGSGSSVSYIRNIATFTNGITTTGSNEVGGIFGYCSGDTVTHVMNAMTGSIQGPSRAGGVFGNLVGGSTNYICNSMVGNISGSVAAANAASASGSGVCTHWVNYMSGDVTSGLVGTVTSRVFSSCIVAMKGATTYAAFQSGHSTSEVLLDESYGITYTSNLGTVSTMDTSSFDSASQYNLPSWTFSFTDNAGNQLDWPFVFGNGAPSETGPPRYQSNPPVTGAVAYLRVHDLASLEDGDTVSSWGTATRTGSPKYKNDSTYDFPYVQLNGGYFTLGEQTIQPSLGFTFVGHVLTTSVGPQYPLIYSYAEARDDGIRIYRTGGSGQDLVFRSQKAASIEARADDATITNTWQVFTSRVTDNGDSTLTMEIFIDNVLQGSVTEDSSDMSGIVSGLLEVGQSTAWTGNPVSPIYITDAYFYDRTLSDEELVDMQTYFTTLSDPYTPPDGSEGGTTESVFVEEGVVMYINANVEASYTPGSSVMNDLSGSSVVFDMKPGISTSLNNGGLDFSAGTNYLKLSQALQVQTISLWYKKGISPAGKFIELRDTNGGGETVANINQSTIQGDFFLNGSIYVNGLLTSGTDYINLPDDAWYNVVFIGSYLTGPTRLTLFANLNLDFPYELIFGSAIFYNRVLTEAEIIQNYNTIQSNPEGGLGTTVTIDIGVSDLAVVPKVFFANLSWTPRNLARSYKVEYTGTDGSSGTSLTPEDNIRVGSLTPNTGYEFVLYSSDGGSFQVYGESVTSTTLENLVSNYDATDFEDSSGNIDLTSLTQEELGFIGENMNEIFSTGDTVVHSINNGSFSTKFVERGDTIAITGDKSSGFSVPFDESAGTGQEVTISTDTQDIIVSYNETTNQIVVGGNSYSSGESFVVDGRKMIMYDI